MMKIKVSEAEREALNWLVAQAEGHDAVISGGDVCSFKTVAFREYKFVWEPSTNWAQGGAIIEREHIALEYLPGAGDGGLDVWVATRIEGSSLSEECAPTPLIAAMRCYVAAMLGDEVDVPDELTGVNK